MGSYRNAILRLGFKFYYNSVPIERECIVCDLNEICHKNVGTLVKFCEDGHFEKVAADADYEGIKALINVIKSHE